MLENKKKLEEEIKYNNQLLEQTQKSTKKSLNQIAIIQKQIADRERLINNINQEIGLADAEINKTHTEIDKLTTDIQKIKAEYGKMIYYSYRNKDRKYQLMYILASDNISQAYRRFRYFQQYNEYLKKQALLIQQKQSELSQKQQVLEVQKQEKTTLLGKEQVQKNQLANEQDKKTKAVQELKKQEKDIRKQIQQKQAQSKQLQKKIEAVIAEEIRKAREREKKAAEAAAKAAREAKKEAKETANAAKPATTKPAEKAEPPAKPAASSRSDVMALTPEEQNLANSFANNRGKLPWPTERGVVSETFGIHNHEELKGIVKENSGISILTTPNAKARCVFSGIVTTVMNQTFGNQFVLIRHGDYFTVYTNLSSVTVKPGDKVSTKQEIGTIYTDPSENKTELNFQIWKGATKYDPSIWLIRK